MILLAFLFGVGGLLIALGYFFLITWLAVSGILIWFLVISWVSIFGFDLPD